jgi:hypothetical protein
MKQLFVYKWLLKNLKEKKKFVQINKKNIKENFLILPKKILTKIGCPKFFFSQDPMSQKKILRDKKKIWTF